MNPEPKHKCGTCGRVLPTMFHTCPTCYPFPAPATIAATEAIARLNAQFEAVDHPKHYNMGKFEVIEVIHDWKLGFNLGNAIKYIGRAKHKGNAKEDLEKAVWYLQDEIKRLAK